MPKQHFKTLQTNLIAKRRLPVNAKESLIEDVVILQEGMDKDGYWFSPEFLDDLIEAGNEQPQGVKSRFGHPNMCQTSLGSYIGRFKNFRGDNSEKGQNKVVADLYLDEITKRVDVEGKGISMHDYILEMAKNNSDVFGNSIHFKGYTEDVKKEINGAPQYVESYKLESFIASDLVDMPAATDSLFKNSDDMGVIASRFLDENPELFKLLQKDNSILDNFLRKYSNTLKTKEKKMNLLEKIKKALGADEPAELDKDIDLTLANGDMVTVTTDAQAPSIGDEVRTSDGSPLENGNYLLSDGSTLNVSNGTISSITPPKEEAKELPKQKKEISLEKLNKKIEDIATANLLEVKSIELLGDKLSELYKEFKLFKRTIKSAQYQAPNTPDGQMHGNSYANQRESYLSKSEDYFNNKKNKKNAF